MKLTEKQRAVLEFIKMHISSMGYPPTIREICGHFGFASPLSAKQHVDALHRKGYIRKSPLKGRGIEIAGIRPSGTISLPIVGRIRAGEPVPAAEEIESYISIDSGIFRTDRGFGLSVVGDSMIDAGIFEGDIALIEPGHDIKNGDIVVVMIGDEATIKRFYRQGSKISLVPENRSMKPIVVRSSEVRIVGRVMGIIRRF